MGLYNDFRGYMGAPKTYANAKRFCYYSGMFDWICASTVDCLVCQKNKPRPKHLKEVPLEDWGKTAPFCAIHINHKGPLHPASKRITHCFLVVEFFNISGWSIVLLILARKLHLQQLNNQFFNLGRPSLSYMIEEQPFLIQVSLNGQKKWELHFNHVLLSHLGRTAE